MCFRQPAKTRRVLLTHLAISPLWQSSFLPWKARDLSLFFPSLLPSLLLFSSLLCLQCSALLFSSVSFSSLACNALASSVSGVVLPADGERTDGRADRPIRLFLHAVAVIGVYEQRSERQTSSSSSVSEHSSSFMRIPLTDDSFRRSRCMTYRQADRREE